MPTDIQKFAAASKLDAVNREIGAIEQKMRGAEARWLVATAIPGRQDKMILKLRPEFSEADVRATWTNWQIELTDLLERRVELLRELNLDQEAVNGT